MIGQTISHYKIVEKLGEGGMGVVYKAQDMKLDRLVALKFLPPEFTRDPDAKQRFIHEAKAASSLDHPNICNVHEVDETPNGQLFIAMAIYDGASLSKKIEKSPLKIEEVLDIAAQIAEGLQAAHEKGITHRDIKSSNIIVTEKSRAVIMDFGLARTTGATKLTESGSTVGTVPFMSPEQARGEKVNHRSDIWSLGAVIYEMVTGQLPFKSQYNEAIVYSILNENPQPVTAVRSGVPMELERIINKCLEKKASDRYQHIDELIVDLRQARSQVSKEPVTRKPSLLLDRRWFIYGGSVIALALLVLLTLQLFKGKEESIKSIAVLPLDNLSRDPEQEYFADGMTEALITDLAKISSLRVISRTSVMLYKTRKKTVPEIAKELNVDAVVEGSVQRSGDRVRITAQLLHAPTDRHLWAESYERNMTDVLSLQSELALAIAKEIRAKVTPQEETHLTSAGPVNKEAYELYLKGRYHWNKRTEEGLKKGIEHFKQAIEKDPGYPLAYAGLADSYYILAYYSWLPPKEAYPKARAAAMKALELDNLLAEGHATLASVKRDFDWDWVEAEKQFRLAFELNPSYSYAHLWCANLFNALGRREEALTEMKKALELDPLSLIINADLGRTFYFARQYDQSLEQFRKTLDMDPNFAVARLWLGQVYEQRRMYETAISEFQKGISLSGGSTYALARLGHAYAVGGRRVEAQMVLNQLNDLSKQKYVSPYDIAVIYAGMGEKNQAFAWLERAYDERSLWLTFLKVDPSLDPLRSDPRFTELLKKIGLQPSESDNTSSLPTIEKPATEPSPVKWRNSIAVLPFKNISSDKEQEYFCDGMTEAIITDLAKLSQLVVMSPSAVAPYKGKNVDVRSIEEKLQVRYVVEGSVQRSGSALRVTAQLINTESGVQMWANRFDRTIQDVFAVQDDISGKIVAALQLKLSAGEQQKLGGRPTQNLEAYDLYLRGRFYQNRRSVEATDLAIPLLERATAIDPNFAAAFAALGSTYTQKSFYDEPLKKDWDQKAFVAVENALSIDPNLAEAYVAKGNLLWTPSNRFPHDKAIAAYRHAIELRPSYNEAHEFLGFVYNHIGLLEEGLKECRKALQINPNSEFAQSRVGAALLYMDRNEEALVELRKVPEGFNPQIIPTQIAIALSYLERRQEAKEILNNVSKQMPEDPFLLSTQALMLAGEGRNDEALKKIDLAMKREKTYLGHFHHAAYNLGSAFALLKRNGDAVEWLRKAAEGGFPCYPKYERDSNLNNLRQDAAFRTLLNDLKKQWESYKAML